MIDQNEPAFPFPHQDVQYGDGHIGPYFGITKREYFAAMAMQGMLACPDNSGSPEAYAKDAVKQADALIAALSEVAKHGS